MKADAWRVLGYDLLLLETDEIVHLGLDGCHNLYDQCVMNMVNKCSKLTSMSLRKCRNVTDAGVSALRAICGQLRSIKVLCCRLVADAFTSAATWVLNCGNLPHVTR